VEAIYKNPSIVKLFYREHYNYNCYSQNWGESKGIDHYQDVCVVLSDAHIKAFERNNLRGLASTTKNKLYVACSRAKGDLIFVPESVLRQYKKG